MKKLLMISIIALTMFGCGIKNVKITNVDEFITKKFDFCMEKCAAANKKQLLRFYGPDFLEKVPPKVANQIEENIKNSCEAHCVK